MPSACLVERKKERTGWQMASLRACSFPKAEVQEKLMPAVAASGMLLNFGCRTTRGGTFLHGGGRGAEPDQEEDGVAKLTVLFLLEAPNGFCDYT